MIGYHTHKAAVLRPTGAMGLSENTGPAHQPPARHRDPRNQDMRNQSYQDASMGAEGEGLRALPLYSPAFHSLIPS